MRTGMFLDPLEFPTDDNNTLKVPSLSPVDGRVVFSRERFYSDSNPEEGAFDRSVASSPSPSLLHIERAIQRPVSEQNISRNSGSRKEKAVSWHSKMPTSTQTLGGVEGVNEEKDRKDIPNAQSQPLLGTLESSSSNKHICRHTFSVKQVKSPFKDQKRNWSLRRCVSSGSEKTRLREKYMHLRSSKIEDCSSPVTTANEARLARQLSNSRQNSVDTAKSEELSLIDWEEDEKLCDAEVGHITGQFDDDEDDVRPTSEHIASSPSHVDDKAAVINELELCGSENNHSSQTPLVPKSTICDEEMVCDHGVSNYAVNDARLVNNTNILVPISPSATRNRPVLKSPGITNSCFLAIPNESLMCSPLLHRGKTLSATNTLNVPRGLSFDDECPPKENAFIQRYQLMDEQRPPLKNPQSGESHL